MESIIINKRKVWKGKNKEYCHGVNLFVHIKDAKSNTMEDPFETDISEEASMSEIEEHFVRIDSDGGSDSGTESDSEQPENPFTDPSSNSSDDTQTSATVSPTASPTVSEKASPTPDSPPRQQLYSARERIQILKTFDLKLDSYASARFDRYNLFLDKALEFARESPESEWNEAMVIIKGKDPLLWDLIQDKMPQGHNLDYPTYLEQMITVLNCNSEHLDREWTNTVTKHKLGLGGLPEHYRMYEGYCTKHVHVPLTFDLVVFMFLLLLAICVFLAFCVWVCWSLSSWLRRILNS